MTSNLSYEYVDKFTKDIFLPLKKGQCVSCMFAAGGGKRTIIKSLLSNVTILKSIFGNQYGKTLFVYVDPDELIELSNINYLELIYNSLKREAEKKQLQVSKEHDHNYLLKIKEALTDIIDQGWMVIFILNDLEITMSLSPSIYLNLETIMGIDKSKIVYLFLSTNNLFDENVIKNLHNLKYAVSRNVVYFPLFNKSDAYLVIDQVGKKLHVNIAPDIKDVLYESCGGHPQLLKYATYSLYETAFENITHIDKVKTYLTTHDRLKTICSDIWNYLSQREKNSLNRIVVSGEIETLKSEEAQYLLKLGLFHQMTENKYKVFGLIFEEYIKNKLPKQKLSYNQELKKLFIGTLSCEDKFTYQEFKLIVYFVTHENELITRDQVAEAIWGKLQYQEKYSDWSIDKTISIIRKKLDSLGFPSDNLATLKKRGFSFSNVQEE